jgi:hypothetical protein
MRKCNQHTRVRATLRLKQPFIGAFACSHVQQHVDAQGMTTSIGWHRTKGRISVREAGERRIP